MHLKFLCCLFSVHQLFFFFVYGFKYLSLTLMRLETHETVSDLHGIHRPKIREQHTCICVQFLFNKRVMLDLNHVNIHHTVSGCKK